MLEPYSYPDELYCDQCRMNVKTAIEERIAAYDDRETGKEVTVRYKAAVCPVCGNTLCERDQEIAFANMVSKMTDHDGGNRNASGDTGDQQ